MMNDIDDGCGFYVIGWLIGVMVMVVIVIWGSGWDVWHFRGADRWFEEAGVESGEDVHGRCGWDAMMQWRAGWWIGSWQ